MKRFDYATARAPIPDLGAGRCSWPFRAIAGLGQTSSEHRL